jgi:hypothetical protein
VTAGVFRPIAAAPRKIHLREDGESALRPTTAGGQARTLDDMETRHIKRQLILAALFAALLVVAVAGWTVQGGRRLVPAT